MKSLIGKLLILSAFFILGGCVLYLWSQQRDLQYTVEQLKRVNTFIEKPPGSQVLTKPTPIASNSSEILAKLEALEKTVAELQSQNKTPASTSTNTFDNFSRQVLYLGSAETTNRDWTRTGLEITLNSNDYPANASATFEAGLSIIGGQAWARLVNTSTGAIITASEVSHGSSTVTWKSSAQFKLHPGQNVYAVEIRSSSNERAQMSGARIILQ